MTKPSRAKRIADLNDKFRKTFVTGGRVYMTAGVNGRGPEFDCERDRVRRLQREQRPAPCARLRRVRARGREPCLGKLVSSMIQTSIGPSRSVSGSTISRTLASTTSSDHMPSATKCKSTWCCAPTRSGAAAAIELDALSFARKQQARAAVTHRPDASRMPHHAGEPIEIPRETLRAATRLPSQGIRQIADSQRRRPMAKWLGTTGSEA